MYFKEGLTFDDVLLVPKKSPIVSRSQTNLKTRLSSNVHLNIPIISANMDSVTESKMAIALAREGGIGIVHRFMTIQEQVEQVLKVKRSESVVIEQPYTISPDIKIREANSLMQVNGISGLLVKDSNNKLCGILTRRDTVFEKNIDTLVSDLMTKDVVSAKIGTNIEQAKEILHKHRIEKLPVVNEEGEIYGLITGKDILKMEEFPNASKDKKGRLLVGAAVGGSSLRSD